MAGVNLGGIWLSDIQVLLFRGHFGSFRGKGLETMRNDS